MSRSIHTTRRDLERLEATEFGVPEQREAALGRARERLDHKRRVKAAVGRQRRARPTVAPTPIATIPVVVTERGEHVHYPASVEDVRAVMRSLPRGVPDGLARVELRLGAETQREHEMRDPGGCTPDPFVGRLGYEWFPSVYVGRVLGTYSPDTAAIRLNAFVYHAATPLREVWEILLRLRALATLAHEVGHHHDHTMRVARGRWIAHGDERIEMYAEGREHAWVQGVVVPYLRRAYPVEVERVERWVAHHGGVTLSLESLADDPRGTLKGGGVSLNVAVWSMAQALDRLVRDVLAGEPLSACRVHFARELHYREMYDEALASLARVLADEPSHAEALPLRADIFEHQGRYEEALAVAEGVLADDAGYADAWEVAADALEGLGRWAELRVVADRLVELYRCPDDRPWLMQALFQRALACIRSDDHAAAAADLDAIEASSPTRWQLRRLGRLRAELSAAYQENQRPS